MIQLMTVIEVEPAKNLDLHSVPLDTALSRAASCSSSHTVPLPLLASFSRSVHSSSPGSLACQFIAMPFSAFFSVSLELE